MDYILAAYLAADQAALSYAVGEWARIWPLQQLIRSMGAYFVRRNSRDELYRRVLERYIVMATEAGVTQAVYPGGRPDARRADARAAAGRARLHDARLRPATASATWCSSRSASTTTACWRTARCCSRSSRDGQRPGVARRAWNTLALRGDSRLALMARSDWHRFGYACVNFGTPMSMREYCRERATSISASSRRRTRTRASPSSARHLMDAIGRLVPVLPVPLVAHGVRAPPGPRRSRSSS